MRARGGTGPNKRCIHSYQLDVQPTYLIVPVRDGSMPCPCLALPLFPPSLPPTFPPSLLSLPPFLPPSLPLNTFTHSLTFLHSFFPSLSFFLYLTPSFTPLLPLSLLPFLPLSFLPPKCSPPPLPHLPPHAMTKDRHKNSHTI